MAEVRYSQPAELNFLICLDHKYYGLPPLATNIMRLSEQKPQKLR